MVYFCADDYGISPISNSRIEQCLHEGVLNKVSVLPNGKLTDFKDRLSEAGAVLSLHLNFVEGKALCDPEELDLITTGDGCFKHSFAGLFLLSLTPKRKKLEAQLRKEMRAQLLFWKQQMGDQTPLVIDSHQHTLLIPVLLKTLMRVIEEEKLPVATVRIAAEPLTPYLLTPSLWFAYKPKGIIKQWILQFLALVNRRKIKSANLHNAYFMGAMFSGRMTEDKIKKLLPHYLKIAEKQGKDVEIALHPGYIQENETMMDGVRDGFKKFYFSPWRKREFDTLMHFHLEQQG